AVHQRADKKGRNRESGLDQAGPAPRRPRAPPDRHGLRRFPACRYLVCHRWHLGAGVSAHRPAFRGHQRRHPRSTCHVARHTFSLAAGRVVGILRLVLAAWWPDTGYARVEADVAGLSPPADEAVADTGALRRRAGQLGDVWWWLAAGAAAAEPDPA